MVATRTSRVDRILDLPFEMLQGPLSYVDLARGLYYFAFLVDENYQGGQTLGFIEVSRSGPKSSSVLDRFRMLWELLITSDKMTLEYSSRS